MIERFIALVLTKMRDRLVEFLTDEETAVLQQVIEFYNFAYKEKLKNNPQEVLNELLEVMSFREEDEQ